ncbi:MAG: hypothetical protein FJ161_00650 [Gammaproteobacteria bacterium]|nr:hypothetical protein [Gammaproteobacteria bacterium]
MDQSPVSSKHPFLTLIETRPHIDKILSELLHGSSTGDMLSPELHEHMQAINQIITDYTACSQFSAIPSCEEYFDILPPKVLTALTNNAVGIGYLSEALNAIPSRSALSHLLWLFVLRCDHENRILKVILSELLHQHHDEIQENHHLVFQMPESLMKSHTDKAAVINRRR